MSQYIATGASFEEIIAQALPIVNAAQGVLQDPALGEIVCQTTRLSRITDGREPGARCKKTVITAQNKNDGLGLSSALPGLRAFVWIRENPVLASATITAALGMFWFWGFSVGHRRGKKVVP